MNPSQVSGFPEGFIGFAVEGPSREGFFVYPIARPRHRGGAAARLDADSPHVYPDAKSREVVLRLRPRPRADGRGRTTVTLDGRPIHLDLGRRQGHRRHLRPLRPDHPLDRRQRPDRLLRRPDLHRRPVTAKLAIAMRRSAGNGEQPIGNAPFPAPFCADLFSRPLVSPTSSFPDSSCPDALLILPLFPIPSLLICCGRRVRMGCLERCSHSSVSSIDAGAYCPPPQGSRAC